MTAEWTPEQAPLVNPPDTSVLDLTSAGTSAPQPAAHVSSLTSVLEAPRPERSERVATGSRLDAQEVSAWFGSHKVLERVSLSMPSGVVTALIGPSGCGKSTFLRILNRMHESVPNAQLNGRVLLDGEDIYDPARRITETRRRIGMVFQKPNPFPAMSIEQNVLAGLKLTGTKIGRAA